MPLQPPESDPLVQRFEGSLQQGNPARIEDCLADRTGAGRDVLLEQLLKSEITRRRRRGDRPQIVEYLERFPESSAIVREVIGEDQVSPDSASAAATAAQMLAHNRAAADRLDDGAETTAVQARTIGKFQLLEQVGAGAFGAVWKARDTELDRTVAVKILHPSLVSAPSDRERFLREARAAAQLRHPGIVTLYEVAELDGLPAIVSMFVEGVTLRDLLRTRGLTPREAAAIVAQVADALDYAHAMKLVHRDIKPANLMIEYGPGESLSTSLDPADAARSSTASSSSKSTPTAVTSSQGGPRALLLDFGLALREEAEATLTADGQVIGTPAYMSPEQAAGEGHRVDGRSDVYALGAVFYELLTGETPFRGAKVAMLHQVLHDEPRRPRSVQPAVPRDLEVVCLKAMAKERGKRYATARELADDLRRNLAGEPIRARRAGVIERLVRWSRRNRALAASLAAIVVLLVATTIASAIAAGRFRYLAQNENQLRRKAQQAEQNEAAERGKAEAAREVTRRNLYFAEMNLAAGLAESPSGVAQLNELVDRWNPQPEQRDLRGWEWRLFRAISRAELAVIELDAVSPWIAWSPDGSRIATASKGGVAFWDAKTCAQSANWPVSAGGVLSVEWSPDRTHFALGGAGERGGFLEVRDADSGVSLQSISDASGIQCLSRHPRGELLAFHSWDNKVHVRHVPPNREVAVLETKSPDGRGGSPPTRMGFSRDGKYLASHVAGQKYPQSAVRVWETETWKEVHTFDGLDRPVRAIAWSPNDRHLAASTEVGELVIWDIESRQVARHLGTSGHRTDALAWSPDGDRLASGNSGFYIQVWNPADGQEMAMYRGHTTAVRAICWSPDGRRFASAGDDGTLRVWDAATAPPVRTVRFSHGEPEIAYLSVAWRADGAALATSVGNQGTKIWDIGRGESTQHVEGILAAWNFDGSHGVSSYREDVTIWDRTLTQPLRSFEIRGQPKVRVWNPRDDRLAIRAADQIWLWDVTRSDQAEIVVGKASPPGSVAWSPGGSVAWSWDGRLLAFGVQNQGKRLVRVMDPATRQTEREFPVAIERIESLAWSPDGRRLAVAGSDPVVRICDTRTGCELPAIAGHTFTVHSLAWHPDGSRLASASADGTVKLWDTSTGTMSVSFNLPGVVRSVAWSADGTGLAAISEGGTLKIWKAAATEP